MKICQSLSLNLSTILKNSFSKMDFPQKKRLNNNENRYHIENLKIAREFSKGLLKELGELIRSIVLFGSNSTNAKVLKTSDVDIMIVLDNVSVFVTPELREAYRVITSSLVNNISDKLHVMTVNLSDLWDMARKGDPVLINILRYGTPLFDRDLVEPMQYLLEIGKIRPTKEAVYNYSSRAETLLQDTDKHMQDAVLDLYYSVIDIVHSTLMCKKITPPSPREMQEIFRETFKGSKLEKYSEIIDEFYSINKDIEHNSKIKISGSEYDKLKKKAEKLFLALKDYVKSNVDKLDEE